MVHGLCTMLWDAFCDDFMALSQKNEIACCAVYQSKAQCAIFYCIRDDHLHNPICANVHGHHPSQTLLPHQCQCPFQRALQDHSRLALGQLPRLCGSCYWCWDRCACEPFLSVDTLITCFEWLWALIQRKSVIKCSASCRMPVKQSKSLAGGFETC